MLLVRQVAVLRRDPFDLVLPWPQPDPEEQDRVRALIASAQELGTSSTRKIEEDGWIGDYVVRELGERGLLGLYVSERYGGQGLSQTGYARGPEADACDWRQAPTA